MARAGVKNEDCLEGTSVAAAGAGKVLSSGSEAWPKRPTRLYE